jgi:putative drug exporter of the RND superfamily
MTGLLYATGRFCSRHHRVVIALWVALAIAIVLVGRAAGAQNSDNLTLPGTGSTLAQDLLSGNLPGQAYGTNPVVIQATTGKVSDSKSKQAIDDTLTTLRKAPGVTNAVDPFGQAGKGSVSKDQTIAYIRTTLSESPSDLTEDDANEIIDATHPASDAGLKVAVGGYLGQAVSKTDTHKSEAIGLLAAVIILLFAFGTATAMALPIVTALIGLSIALAIVKLLGHVVDVPTVAPTLGTMIGLGVGIDYALFIVTRHKLQLNDGMEIEESIARATATLGGAVAFAGGTVVIALCSLLAADIPLVGTMGYCAAISVLTAVLAAVTLLPALLGALGPRINSLRVQIGRTHPDDHQAHGWRRAALAISHRPWRSMLASVVVLGVLAYPVLNLELGSSDSGELPKDTTARQAFDLMSEGFGPGANGPLLVGVKLGSPAKGDQKKVDQLDSQQQAQKQSAAQQQQLDQQRQQLQQPAADPRLTALESAISKTKGVKSVSPATVSKQGTAAVFTAVATTAPAATETQGLVGNLRDDVIPKAIEGEDLTVYLGGQTAGYIDLASRISEKLPRMIAIVVVLSILVLLLAFRSVLLPLKAAVCNLLSVGAAYGVVTFVFQEGHGASLLGLDGPVPIVSYVPLLMFAILFGLSMDYEVFLLSQIQEHYQEDGDTRKAVVDGLATTGRVITSAALIMVFVFASFVLSDSAVVKQFGVGLAVAIAIDATIVRCLLVPAIMTLFGKACWWLPRWLDRALPKISVEGGEFFREREVAAGSAATPAPDRA